jgi:type I restriction enzyme, R subunit
VDLVEQLDAEQLRAAEEGLSEDELAVFDLLQRENLSKADRERVKLASKNQLESLQRQIASMARWTEKEKTQAEVKVVPGSADASIYESGDNRNRRPGLPVRVVAGRQ